MVEIVADTLDPSFFRSSPLTLSILRQHVLAIVRAGIAGADPQTLVKSALAGGVLSRVPQGTKVTVIAAGKASRAMASAFTSEFGQSVRGLIASPQLGERVDGLEWFDVGHPTPTEGSVDAGLRALQLASEVGEGNILLVLLSGGASAGLTVPLEGVSLDDKVRVTRLLLENGISIDGLNCVRKHLSAIKGGRLAIAASGRCITLAISDVVNPVPDDPAVIGSGLTAVDPTTYADALQCLHSSGRATLLPRAVVSVLERGSNGEVEETLKPNDHLPNNSEYHIIGSRLDAMAAAAHEARRLGFYALTLEEPITGEARVSGDAYIKSLARYAHEQPRPLCVVSAGETTVKVRGPGRGGRNQEFALAGAFSLVRRFPLAVVASVGTDGIDGPTDAAGAIIDTTTPLRAANAGLERPEYYLGSNDSYAFFDGVGDLLHTGATATNVGDLQIALIA